MNYQLSGYTLGRVQCKQDLGVLFDSQLTFDMHIDIIVSKAYKSLGFICRHCKDFCNIYSYRLLYITLVRPLLEYCSLVWNPYYKKYEAALERVQNKFLRLIAFRFRIERKRGSYTELLQLLNLNSLYIRRKQLGLLFLFALLNNLIQCSDLLHLINLKVPTLHTRSQNLFYIPHSSCNYLYYLPMSRIARDYNKECTEVDIFQGSKISFKNFLVNHL
jgi:hypothetical protein